MAVPPRLFPAVFLGARAANMSVRAIRSSALCLMAVLGLASCGSLEFETAGYRAAEAARSDVASTSAPAATAATSGAEATQPANTQPSSEPSGPSGTPPSATAPAATTPSTGGGTTASAGTATPSAPPIRQATRVYPKIYNTENRVIALRGTAVRSPYRAEQPPLAIGRDTAAVRTEGRMNLGRDWIDFSRRGTPTQRHGRSDETGVFSGTSSEILLGQVVDGNYHYSVSYSRVYQEGDEVYYEEGVVGIPTSGRDMPVSGEAIYYGGATARVAYQGQTWRLEGRSRANVDFGDGNMRVTLYAMTPDENNTAGASPVDRIIAQDITIAGSSFNGGRVTTHRGPTVDVAGQGATSRVQGGFYGFDARRGIPDEVGGQIVLQGADGGVIGTFISN